MNIKNLLIGLLVIAGFFAGFMLGRTSSSTAITIKQETSTTPKNTPSHVEETASATLSAPGQVDVSSDTPTLTTSTIVSSMSDDQKKMLSALGIDVTQVTPEMIACAEASLGPARVVEVKAGASLSFTEKAKLITCYK